MGFLSSSLLRAENSAQLRIPQLVSSLLHADCGPLDHPVNDSQRHPLIHCIMCLMDEARTGERIILNESYPPNHRVW